MGRYVALGLVLIVAGFVAAVAIAVPRFVGVKDQIEGFPKTRLSEGSVELERRAYDVYIDVPAGTGDFSWTLSVRDPTGREAAVLPSGSTVDYAWGSREGWLAGELRVTTAGRHVLRGTGPPGADVVFADDVVGDMGRSILYAVGALALLGGAGVVLMIVGFGRRKPREPKRWP